MLAAGFHQLPVPLFLLHLLCGNMSGSASSSTGDPGQPVGHESQQRGVTYDPLPHEGYVFLDVVQNKSVITHVLTGERRVLEGCWELSFEDGCGVVVASCDDDDANCMADMAEYRLVEDILQKTLELGSDGSRYIVKNGKRLNADFARSKYDEGQLHISAIAMAGNAQLACFSFHAPRSGGCQLYVSFQDLHRVLQIKLNKGSYAAWMSHKSAAYFSFLQTLLGPGHAVRGTHGNAGAATKGLFWSDRCLPSASCSLPALLALLWRWGFSTKEFGGFENVANRKACQDMLMRFIDAYLAAAGSHKIPMRLQQPWYSVWPRPDAQPDFVIAVGADGVADFSELSWKSRGNSKSAAGLVATWWTTISGLLPGLAGDGRVRLHFKDLIAKIAFHKCPGKLGALFKAQAAGSEQQAQVDAPVYFELGTLAEALIANEDATLAKYLLSGVECTANVKRYSMGTDKANGTGLPLQNSLIGIPSGVLIVAPPVASNLADQNCATY